MTTRNADLLHCAFYSVSVLALAFVTGFSHHEKKVDEFVKSCGPVLLDGLDGDALDEWLDYLMPQRRFLYCGALVSSVLSFIGGAACLALDALEALKDFS